MSQHSKDAIWKVECLNAKVEAEILALPADMQARLWRIAELLEVWGPHKVGMPYTRHLEGRIWEIRLSGKAGISRVMYAALMDRKLILLRAFVKKTQKTPRQEIDLALRRLKESES